MEVRRGSLDKTGVKLPNLGVTRSASMPVRLESLPPMDELKSIMRGKSTPVLVKTTESKLVRSSSMHANTKETNGHTKDITNGNGNAVGANSLLFHVINENNEMKTKISNLTAEIESLKLVDKIYLTY